VAFLVPLQHLGPPLASAVAAWANVAGLAVVLTRRGHLAADATLRRTIPRMILAGLAMVAVLLGLHALVYSPLAASPLLRWAGLGVLVTGGVAAYGVVGQLIGAFDLRTLRRR
jgi:putative peptidoglycan lipid II flippase